MLTVTGLVHVSRPDRESLPLNVTVTSVLFQPLALGAGNAAADAVGTVLSIITAGEVKVALLPAKSVTVTVPDTADPSAANTKGLADGLVEATPDRASAGVNENETSVLFHPFPLAPGLAVPNVRVGAVLSMFIPLWATGELVLPALSVHVPDDDVWAAPSVLTVAGLVQLSMPDRESLPLNVTVTFVLFQPLALAAGEAAAVAVGAALSMFMPLTVVEAVFPARSWQVPFTY